MIYLDTSVALAQLLAEDRQPPEALWDDALVSSRLLEYELWVRIHARGLGGSHGDHVRALLGRVALLELSAPVLDRVIQPFPAPVRTLDAMHLASCEFLRARVHDLRLATYDERMTLTARRMGIPLLDLSTAQP
jgi:predicted nucleic acid-binding protein